jgi:PTH1 family peptidyl-tRNA hydrolase
MVLPTTFMNRSGEAVADALGFYQGLPADLIVVHDDLDFAPGTVRLKQGGGEGGHNGLRSIVAHVGSEFARIRVGIGKPVGEGVEHVLSRFNAEEAPLISNAVATAADAVEAIIADGMPKAMGRFNRKAVVAAEDALAKPAPEGAVAAPEHKGDGNGQPS